MSALGEVGEIAGGLLGNIGKIILIIALLVGLFFGTKKIQKIRLNKKNYKITAVISTPDGTHYSDLIGKFKDKDGMEKMKFKHNKTDSCPIINPKYIVGNSIALFRYGPSEFAIIPPECFREATPEKFGIKLINQNMLAFKGMEQRAAITRWQTNKDKLQQWLPWITIVICVGMALASIYFVYTYASEEATKVIEIRTQECSTLLSTETMSDVIVQSINYKLGVDKINVTKPV
jgi:hypothetical protein